MSVFIKGMEMPTNCMDCPFKGFDRAGGRGNICTINESITLHAVIDGVDVKFVRMGDCPLVHIPPHGRLIDADALKLSHCVECTLYPKECLGDECDWDSIWHLEHAPTIIEAEEVE